MSRSTSQAIAEAELFLMSRGARQLREFYTHLE
jgi:hypothetical protein